MSGAPEYEGVSGSWPWTTGCYFGFDSCYICPPARHSEQQNLESEWPPSSSSAAPSDVELEVDSCSDAKLEAKEEPAADAKVQTVPVSCDVKDKQERSKYREVDRSAEGLLILSWLERETVPVWDLVMDALTDVSSKDRAFRYTSLTRKVVNSKTEHLHIDFQVPISVTSKADEYFEWGPPSRRNFPSLHNTLTGNRGYLASYTFKPNKCEGMVWEVAKRCSLSKVCSFRPYKEGVASLAARVLQSFYPLQVPESCLETMVRVLLPSAAAKYSTVNSEYGKFFLEGPPLTGLTAEHGV